MKIELPILKQEMKDDSVISEEHTAIFDIDTSVYSEERWEQNFPLLAEKEGLFEYINRIDKLSKDKQVTERVTVACMLKAVYCFVESKEIPTYKSFAQLFILSAPEYTERLVSKLHEAFKAILGGSSTKN